MSALEVTFTRKARKMTQVLTFWSLIKVQMCLSFSAKASEYEKGFGPDFLQDCLYLTDCLP